jgi:hypothetical protein
LTHHAFTAIGQRIERRFAETRYDERAFAEIAYDALTTADLPCEIDFDDVFELICERHKVSLAPPFGDVPLEVFRTRDFVIQLLVWVNGDASIHEHDFSGAFAVLCGETLHGRYDFIERRRINAYVRVGDARCKGFEILKAGDVRQIDVGAGLTHAALHLARPTISLVARTRPGRHFLPEPALALLAPHFALSPYHIDPVARPFRLFLHALEEAAERDAGGALLRHIARFELPVIVLLAPQLLALAGRCGCADELLETIASMHDEEVARLLPDMIAWLRRSNHALTIRRDLEDEELRFILAVLGCAPDRANVLALLKRRFPGVPPVERLAAALIQLRESQAIPLALSGADAPDVLADFLRGVDLDDALHRLRQTYAEGSLESIRVSLERAYRSLRDLPLLGSVWPSTPAPRHPSAA